MYYVRYPLSFLQVEDILHDRGTLRRVRLCLTTPRETQRPLDITDQIGGWATISVGQGYGSGYSINVLQEWMDKAV
jgi:hypothetical protein